jgi:hypothetical protein
MTAAMTRGAKIVAKAQHKYNTRSRPSIVSLAVPLKPILKLRSLVTYVDDVTVDGLLPITLCHVSTSVEQAKRVLALLKGTYLVFKHNSQYYLVDTYYIREPSDTPANDPFTHKISLNRVIAFGGAYGVRNIDRIAFLAGVMRGTHKYDVFSVSEEYLRSSRLDPKVHNSEGLRNFFEEVDLSANDSRDLRLAIDRMDDN